MSEILATEETILTKDDLGHERAGRELSWILRATYGIHNLSSSEEQIIADIQNGKILPFFLKEKGDILSSAALIFNHQAVEIGRNANTPRGRRGGFLMRHAIEKTWKNNPNEWRVLVAEIRMATRFEGIDGGQGSQGTLLPLHKIGMIPHAFLPTFHHPGPKGPDRQEMFCFSSLEKETPLRVIPGKLVLPDFMEMNLLLLTQLLTANIIQANIEIADTNLEDVQLMGKEISRIPFRHLEITNQQGQVNLKNLTTDPSNPFTLVSVDANKERLANICVALIKENFILSGISAPFQGRLKLLFGRLDKCLLAPTELMRNFPRINPELIMILDEQFRSQAKT